MSKQLSILVTSDDGPECPTLVPLLNELKQAHFCQEVCFVIPPEERSWISQAISRGAPIKAKATTIGDINGYLLDGNPADCVAIGAHNLCESPPDLVISGINIGTNSTTCFTYNSGTVGAARQAAASRIFAIAYSAHVPMDVFEAWNRRDKAALEAQASSWATISKLCAAMTEPLYRCFKKRGVDYLSVNVPYQADKETPIHLTRLERWHFNRLFEEEPGTLEFRLRTSIEIVEKADDDPGDNPVPGDLGTQLDGAISVTPFRLDANGITDAEAGTLQKELDEAIEN